MKDYISYHDICYHLLPLFAFTIFLDFVGLAFFCFGILFALTLSFGLFSVET